MNSLEQRLNELLDEALEEDALENEPAVELADENGFKHGFVDATPIGDNVSPETVPEVEKVSDTVKNTEEIINSDVDDTISESFDKITALLDSLNEELDGAPETKIENNEIEDDSADRSDVYPDDEDDTTDEIPENVDVDNDDVYGSEDEEKSTDLKESYIALFNILEDAGILSVERSKSLATGLEDDTLEKDNELKDPSVDRSDVYPDDEDDTTDEIPENVDVDNDDFYNSETEAEATEVDSSIAEALEIIRGMSDIQLLEFLDTNGFEPSIENVNILEYKLTNELQKIEKKRFASATSTDRGRMRRAGVKRAVTRVTAPFRSADSVDAARDAASAEAEKGAAGLSKKAVNHAHNIASIGGSEAEETKNELAKRTAASRSMQKSYAAAKTARAEDAHKAAMAEKDAETRRQIETADSESRRTREVADSEARRKRDDETSESQRRIDAANNSAKNSRIEANHANSRDRAEANRASARRIEDLNADSQRTRDEADSIRANAKAHKAAMKTRVKYNRPQDGDRKGMLFWKKRYDASSGKWVREECELTDIELMEILEYNDYEPSIENAILLKEGLELGEYEIFYEEDELDVSDPKEEQYDIDDELEPEEDDKSEVKPEDLHEEDAVEPEDLISHEKEEKPEGGEVDQNLEIAGDSEENHEDPTTDLPIENKESDSEVKPEDIHESIQYTSIKEACMLDEGYFYEDTFIRESAETKQAKLIEQISLIIARESGDPLYEELLKSAAYTARLQEACSKKYKNKALKEAKKVMGEPKETLSENFH